MYHENFKYVLLFFLKKKKEINLVAVISASVDDEEPSLGEFLNHSGPVNSLQVHNGVLYTCSGDNTARAYSLVVCSWHFKILSSFISSAFFFNLSL